MNKLAIHGGKPVRSRRLNYGRQTIDEDDIAAVVATLRSDFLTTGPKVSEFEEAFANHTQSDHAVAVANGTAALHTAMNALGIQEGDEVIVPTLTFAATANCVLYQRGKPVLVDVSPETLTICPQAVQNAITPHTKAIIAMDYAGQPCDYDRLQQIANEHQLALIADACHSLGATYKGRRVGNLADLTVFSFHPVKPMTTGEGGMITTHRPELADRMRRFRNHGISVDHREREENGSWLYEIADLGYNYRLTDIQCALGISQLNKLPHWTQKRQSIAQTYNSALSAIHEITPLKLAPKRTHAYHLYVIRIDFSALSASKPPFFQALQAEGIGANVHYIPVHLHPLYGENFNLGLGLCPHAERAYEEMISLPIFPAMTSQDTQDTLDALEKVIKFYRH
ncbi:MAG: UDP-4-amino-4,6-dideoxy-N-acetyl-beta-L-altrosamine transaminase [Myxococcota bacterium]|nr:UDP-4-amino-4,6-dideoxy-N-acetyl-beta-L-altrosamine transaminase [Myxococcota bacterium]